VHAAAAGLRVECATNRAGRDVAGPGARINAAPDFAEDQVTGAAADLDRAADVADVLIARPGVRSELALRGRGDLVADADILLKLAVLDSADPDRVPGLLDWRLRLDGLYLLGGAGARAQPVVAGADGPSADRPGQARANGDVARTAVTSRSACPVTVSVRSNEPWTVWAPEEAGRTTASPMMRAGIPAFRRNERVTACAMC
jgi:hypothetical protein